MRHCQGCGEPQEAANLPQCSACKLAFYCNSTCQTKDWPAHKRVCADLIANPPPWYYEHSWNRDRSRHEGNLEMITWDSPAEGLGWGHCVKDESAELKHKFETEFNGDEKKFFEHWPTGFRWTCCGTDAESDQGCDHHGTGGSPCTCDFCRAGKPLPNSIYKEKTAPRVGLTLSRGPDPRSYNPALAMMNQAGRAMMGMVY